MTLQFNPNKPGLTKEFFYATYVPTRRSPKFKMHSNRGHALNALYNGEGILYKWNKYIEEWTEIARTDQLVNVVNCENCGNDLMKTLSSGRQYKSSTKLWIDLDTENPVMITSCYDCARKLRS